jgi:Rho-binding antiterminator
MTDYTPIDCGLYSKYELAILRGKSLRTWWRESNGKMHIEALKPRDLRTANHEEYLIAEDLNGRQLQVRLDYILKTEVV